MDGCRLGDGVADTENVAFVDEPLAVLVNPKHGAAESESSPIGAELLHLMADAVVFQVAYAVELLGAGGDSHVDAVAEVARRADALEGGQIEAPFGHAAVVVGEAARGHDDGFGLVLHQVAEGVDGVHAVDGAVLVIAEFQGAVVETDVRRRIAQLLLHGHHVAHVGRAVLPPVEGVNGADADAEGVVVDGAFQLATALIDEPFDVCRRVVAKILVQQAIGHPLSFSELLLHDDGAIDLDVLLFLETGVHGEGALNALAVTAERGLGLKKNEIVTVLGGLHGGSKSGKTTASMTMLVSMTSTTSSDHLDARAVGTDERLPVVAKSVDAEPLVCGAQPARPAAAALAAPRVPKARKLLRDRFSIVFSSICFGILCDCYAEKPLEAS